MEEDFSVVVSSAVASLGQDKVAALLSVSPASVRRYAAGRNRPHPLMEREMIDILRLVQPTETPL